MVLSSIQNFDQEDVQTAVASVVKLSFLLYLPLFSYFFLKNHILSLENADFIQKWGSLYTNLYPLKSSVYEVTTLFCVKRLIYAITTVYMGSYVVPNIYVYIFIPLFSIGYNTNNKPMNSKLLNLMENLNEMLILSNGYFLFVFTQWICDPKVRYSLGWIYIFMNTLVIFINFVIIIYDMLYGLRKVYKKYVWQRQVDKRMKILFERKMEEIEKTS